MLLKLYLIVSGGIFFLVGIIHLLRLIYQWNIIIGTSVIPLELSYAGCPVSFFYIEPKFHVSKKSFEAMIDRVKSLGFEVIDSPKVFISRTVLLKIK
jgi:hypothetical protein